MQIARRLIVCLIDLINTFCYTCMNVSLKAVYWYKYSSLITKLIELGYRQISRMYATTDSAES